MKIRTKEPGALALLDSKLDAPIVNAKGNSGLGFFISYWRELGCLEAPAMYHAKLTVKGWDRLDPMSSGAGIEGRAFVAMSFSDPLKSVWTNGVQPALEVDCGFDAVRVDQIPNDEKICDRILAEIRKAQVVVADVTEHKQGVYFEAGFALGLGRRVIWTCKKSDIEKAHFDTRQYPHILWNDETDLRNQLRAYFHARGLSRIN